VIRRTIRSWLGARPDVSPHVSAVIGPLSGWAITLIGIIAALIVLGFQMGPLVLLLLILAGMAAISGRRILENWASGLVLQIMAPFTVGDRIETEGITGWVEEINSREVVLTSQDRRTVRIPNATVANSVLYNYTDDEQRRSQIGFSVGYDQDVNAAKTVATEAVAALGLVHSDPAPVGYIDELGDDGFVCQMRFYHNDSDRIRVRDQVALAIATALTKAGISMPTPELIIYQSRTTDASRIG